MHTLISFSNGFMNGDPLMVRVLTIWSSSIVWMSSTLARIEMPVSLYCVSPNDIGSQSSIILFIAFSRECSFVAAALQIDHLDHSREKQGGGERGRE